MITINDAFRKFLNEQKASLKSDTFLDCEDVILLYEEFLEFSAEDCLSEEDRDLYAGQHEHDNKNHGDIFGPENLIPSGIKRLFNIFWDCQNLPLISLAIDCNQYKTRK